MSKILQSCLIILFFLVSLHWCQAQKFLLLTEPVFKIKKDFTPSYSTEFGIENRTILIQDDSFDYEIKHIQVTHFSTIKLQNDQRVGLGLQYRFQKEFNDSKENEFRFQQQYQIKNQKFTHRFRTEQRFYETYTKYRARYHLKYSIPFNTNLNLLDIATESLWQIGTSDKPELEHRFMVSNEFSIYQTLNIEVGAQYRLSDYSNDLIHELFIFSTVSLKL